MNEPDRRSLTPCLDENGDDENCLEDSKEIELSDISDEDENHQWPDQCNNKADDDRAGWKANGNGSKAGESPFKKITRSTRERNYRDNLGRKPPSQHHHHQPQSSFKRFDVKRKEIERYNVRNVITSREFTISRSNSRSLSPRPRLDSAGSRYRSRSVSPKRDTTTHRRRSTSHHHHHHVPARYRSPRRYSPAPASPKHSSPSLERYRHNYRQSPTPKEAASQRSHHKASKIRSIEKPSKRRKKSKERPRKHKRSSSKTKHRSESESSISAEEPTVNVVSRQIMNANLPQENIKVIVKNDDALAKRQKAKKKDRRGKKEKILRKEPKDKVLKPLKDAATMGKEMSSKEVFASGDNILISVCFNNNNNNTTTTCNATSNTASNNATSAKLKESETVISEQPAPTKSKKRQPSPASSVISFEEPEKRSRKHKRKKVKNRPEKPASSSTTATTTTTTKPPPPAIKHLPMLMSKRKSDVKPIAIIDLEKSPGKQEIVQSPKEIIVLSDSDGDGGRKRDAMSKDVIFVDDLFEESSSQVRSTNQVQSLVVDDLTPSNTPPPPLSSLVPAQPVLKFALKSKSNILPFNLLHDKAEDAEEQETTAGSNADNATGNSELQQTKEPSEGTDDKIPEPRTPNDVYDPFEPTKSGSVSPSTPPHPPIISDISSNQNNKAIESPLERSLTPAAKEPPKITVLEDQTLVTSSMVSIWTRKELDKKPLPQPSTPPLPPSFNIFSGPSQTTKQHVSLYDGIFANDGKTTGVSPMKPTLKTQDLDKKNSNDDDDDDRTPYSPSSEGYDFEPPPTSQAPKSSFDNIKHSGGDMEQQNNDLGSSSSYTFSSNDDGGGSKTGPLKLTASTLKSFNSSMRSSVGGHQFVNKKTELNLFENYLPPSQQQQNQKSPLVKRQSSSSFLKSKMSRFASSLQENQQNGSPAKVQMTYHHDSIKSSTNPNDDSMLDDDVPSSAVDLVNKDRFLKKTLRLERVADEVKMVLKPHYNKKSITKEEYKEILRKAVPKICHSKTGEINIRKIHDLVEAYVKKVRYKRKAGGHVASSI